MQKASTLQAGIISLLLISGTVLLSGCSEDDSSTATDEKMQEMGEMKNMSEEGMMEMVENMSEGTKMEMKEIMAKMKDMGAEKKAELMGMMGKMKDMGEEEMAELMQKMKDAVSSEG